MCFTQALAQAHDAPCQQRMSRYWSGAHCLEGTIDISQSRTCLVFNSVVGKVNSLTQSVPARAGDLSSPKEVKYTLDYYMDKVEEMVNHGVHAIGIKDMAGLLKPRAATTLIGAIRKAYPDIVIHVHTHDSAGTAVATQLAAAAAGADMIDLAMDAMSGCTSQVRPCSRVFCVAVLWRVVPSSFSRKIWTSGRLWR